MSDILDRCRIEKGWLLIDDSFSIGELFGIGALELYREAIYLRDAHEKLRVQLGVAEQQVDTLANKLDSMAAQNADLGAKRDAYQTACTTALQFLREDSPDLARLTLEGTPRIEED